MFKCLLIIIFAGLSYLSAISNILLENGREIFKKTVPIFTTVTKFRRYTTKIEDSMRVIPISPSEISSFAKIGKQQFERQCKTCPQIWTPCEDIKDKYYTIVGEKTKKPNIIIYGSIKDQQPLGFLMGQYMTPPGVYAPGLTLLVQEMHIEDNRDYLKIGAPLIKRVREDAKEKSATQWVFINDSTQAPLFDHLMQLEKLTICSQWWAGKFSNSRAINFPNIYPITHEDLEEVV